MRTIHPGFISKFIASCCVLVLLSMGSTSVAQQEHIVPTLVNFAGTLTDVSGKPLTGIVGVTFYLYKDQQGGSPLWIETQNVQPDKRGNFTVQLGSTKSQGLRTDLFASGEARWLGVEVQGQEEQPRVLLLSVPYALKAEDAQTLGGLPPSAFALAAASGSSSSTANAPANSATLSSSVAGTGTTDYIPLWTSSSTLGNSLLFQSGTGSTANVGINTTAPASTLDVKGGGTIRGLLSLPASGTATATAGQKSQPLDLVASAYNSSNKAALNQTFQWQAEPVANNTGAPSGSLNLLFASGTASPAETGLQIASNGRISFASGQTFPGTGTVTQVQSGTGLTGGPITGSGTLSLASHSCAGGTALTALPFTCSPFATLGANSFSGNQAVIGNVSATNEVSAGGVPSGNVASGTVEVDAASVNSGSWSPALNFGGGGEAIISNRKGSTNKFGLDFFTNFTPRISITNAGLVGIGNQNPTHMFEVFPPSDSSLDGAIILGANETGSGFAAGNGLFGTGGNDTSSIIDNLAGTGGGFQGGDSTIGSGGDGVNARAGSGPLGSGYAGFFAGDIDVTGAIFAGTKDFRIDHPLDPAGKYLVHASVESSQMVNIYSGNVSTNARGEATVQLPDWFEALNTDFRYQLTVIGQFAQAIVAKKISNHQFTIRTSAPSVEVSWQITGARQDAYAKAHPLVVEQEKEARLRGFYIHPELYGAPPEKQIEWARHPQMQMMRRHSAVRPVAQLNNAQPRK